MKSRTLTLIRLLGGVIGFVIATGVALAQTALTPGTVGQTYSPPGGLQITTIPPAAAGTVYSATGLPPGLSINGSTGLITGTPTTAGAYPGTVSLLSGGSTNNFAVSITINPPTGTLTITSAATATGTVGPPAFSYSVTASTLLGAPVISFNIGALPAGLSIGGTTTAPTITGTPTTAGTYTVSLSANNLNGAGPVKTLTITVSPPATAPTITSAATLVVTSGAVTYNVTTSTDGTANAPTAYAASGLPAGLAFDTSLGKLTGTPTSGGVFTITLTATNAAGTGAAKTLTLTYGSLPAIPSGLTATGGVGAPFSYTIPASNSPTSFNIAGLPAGLVANTTTGAISGSPTATGTYPVTVSANNSTGTGSAATLTITVGNLPAITSAATASGTVGVPFTFTATASNGATSFAMSGLPAGLSANGLGTVSGSPTVSGTFPVTVSATNAFGTGPNSILTLTIAAAPVVPPVVPPGGGLPGVAPTITTQPVAQSAFAGGSVTFSVVAAGDAPLNYQWKKDGLGLSGAISSTLALTSLKSSDAGSYVVVISNGSGFILSDAVALTVSPVVIVVPPVITTQPADQNVAPGAGATFTVVATGVGPVSYQWRKNGAAIAGATAASLTLANVQAAAAGDYDVLVGNSAGTATSNAARLAVGASRLMNVSVRSPAGTGDQTLIVGFRIEGTGTKQVLLRGVGPTLTQLDVPGVLADPQLKLFNNAGVQTNQNEDWGGGASLAAAFASVGAFALPANSKDAALLLPLPVGNATAHVTSAAGTGVALIEAYDADAGSSTARFINVSARTQVGTGANILFAGFVIDGNAPKTVLIRGVGPGLTQLPGMGAVAVLADPQLRLFNAAGQQIQESNDWGGGATLTGAFAQVGAFTLPAASKDAALLVTLQPGTYTAQVSGVGNTTGVALIEVYEMP